MEHELIIYRSTTSDGCIYVKIHSPTYIESPVVQLIKNGEAVATKEAQKKFVRFKNNEPGLYTATAELTLADGSLLHIASPEISIVAPAVTPVMTFLPSENNLKGNHKFYDNVKTHYLELKLKKGCLERLDTESPATISTFHGLKNRMAMSKISLKAFWEDSSDEEDCDRCTIKCAISNAEMMTLAQELEALDYVIYCTIVPDTKNISPLDIPAEFIPDFEELSDSDRPEAASGTPNFRNRQTYLNHGMGMNIHAAWQAGETGQAATVRMIDFGIYRNHENLVGNITVVNSRPETENLNHGTASAGCVAARNTNFGVSGIAHECDFFFYETGDLDLIVRDALPGDLVTISIGFSIGNITLPMIDNLSFWERFAILSRRGVTTLLAAGNSGVNLSLNSGVMSQHGDSGAMLVGACYHNTGRRVGFSNHSHPTSLINSWGDWSVATTGYGDLQRINNNRNYTARYNGTSSAAPLACGALALIQSSYLRRGVFLSPMDMRSLIQQTGATNGVSDGIGRRPNAHLALNSSQLHRLDTQEQLTRLGNDQHGSMLAGLLSSHANVEIMARNSVWVARIVFPAATGTAAGRSIFFSTQASWDVTLVVNNQSIVFNAGSSERFIAAGSTWRRESETSPIEPRTFLLNTQALLTQAGQAGSGQVFMRDLLRTHDSLEISSQNGIWTPQITFPAGNVVESGRSISFTTQAQLNTTLLVNGGPIIFRQGSAARFVVQGHMWWRDVDLGFFLINTQAQMNQLGQSTDFARNLLQNHPGLTIISSNGVWTSRIAFPAANLIARGRIISFINHAQFSTSLDVNGGPINFAQGDFARFVADGQMWRRV